MIISFFLNKKIKKTLKLSKMRRSGLSDEIHTRTKNYFPSLVKKNNRELEKIIEKTSQTKKNPRKSKQVRCKIPNRPILNAAIICKSSKVKPIFDHQLHNTNDLIILN